MILNFFIKNSRSFKDEVIFTLMAESSKVKKSNIAELTIGNNDKIRLLKTAAIFGPNASGKSNLPRIFFDILKIIIREKENAINIGEDIDAYDPFLFSEETKNAPTHIKIDFIGYDSNKYSYELEFDKKNILSERLEYYPKGKVTQLLRRETPKDNKEYASHTGYLRKKSKDKSYALFHNQTFLSQFGASIPDEVVSQVFLYFKNIEIVNVTNNKMLSKHRKEVLEKANQSASFLEKLNSLIKIADTGVNEIVINKMDEEEFKVPENFPDKLKSQLFKAFEYNLKGLHNYYQQGKLQHNQAPLSFDEESTGTKTLFTLGGMLLLALEKGIPVFVDELDMSLHTEVSYLLISLFQNNKINSKNAQLIFTSHDTNLLDERLFRKDQIWITEKDAEGITDLFSLQQFSDVRNTTPFEKWYLAGKFGGLPEIESIEKLY